MIHALLFSLEASSLARRFSAFGLVMAVCLAAGACLAGRFWPRLGGECEEEEDADSWKSSASSASCSSSRLRLAAAGLACFVALLALPEMKI